MPIRFRCAYCNQLMGISTRKAGTVVKCPKCAGEIIVPSLDAPPPPEEPAPQVVSPPPVEQPANAGAAFEAKEFEDYFNEAANGSVGATTPVRTEPMPDLAAMPPAPPPLPPKRRGLFLTLPALVVSVIVIFLLLVMVFVLGVVIGRQSASPRESAATLLSYRSQHWLT